MNPKPLKKWTHEELMAECAWLVVEAITQGKPILNTMYLVDSLLVNWRKENHVKI